MRFEEIFPYGMCPCLLEPILSEVLQGEHAELIEVLLSSEVVGIKGSLGNFDVRNLRPAPRYVSVANCVGCGVHASTHFRRATARPQADRRKAIDLGLLGGLPSIPYLTPRVCRRFAERPSGPGVHGGGVGSDEVPVDDAGAPPATSA